MTEFNTQEIIDFLSEKLLLYIGRHRLQNYHWQRENEQAIKQFAENVRTVERYAVEVDSHGKICGTCLDYGFHGGPGKTCEKCSRVKYPELYPTYKHWQPRYTLEDFK